LKKGSRALKGVLAGVTPAEEIVIRNSEGERQVPLDDIKRAHLIYVPQTGQKKTFKKIPKKKK